MKMMLDMFGRIYYSLLMMKTMKTVQCGVCGYSVHADEVADVIVMGDKQYIAICTDCDYNCDCDDCTGIITDYAA